MKKKLFAVVLAVCILMVGVLSYRLYKKESTDPRRFDYAYFKTIASDVVTEYVKKNNLDINITTCNTLILPSSVYVFFDYEPAYSSGPSGIMHYGYAEIGKSFHKYTVTNFATSGSDSNSEFGFTCSGSTQADHTVLYGKILNKEVNKIEVYTARYLAATYEVGVNEDFYLVPVEDYANSSRLKFYDADGNLLYATNKAE